MLASNQTPPAAPARSVRTKQRANNKLTDEQTSTLIAKWQTGEYKQSTLAQEFNVSQGYVSQLCSRARRNRCAHYRHEQDLNGNWRWFVYGFSGEQLEGFFAEESAQSRVDALNTEARRNTLIAERREHEKRIREINSEIARLDGIPF